MMKMEKSLTKIRSRDHEQVMAQVDAPVQARLATMRKHWEEVAKAKAEKRVSNLLTTSADKLKKANKAVAAAKKQAAQQIRRMMKQALRAARSLARKEAKAIVAKHMLVQQTRVVHVEQLLQASEREE